MRMPKSKRGARQQYDSIIRSYKRDFAGGGSFGWDWVTLRINSPERYAHLSAMNAVYSKLPD